MFFNLSLSYDTTRLVGIVLITILFSMNIFIQKVNYISLLFAFLFFILCFPLGHDTLNYKSLIEDDYLTRYGIVWESIYSFYRLFELWWIVHFIAYIIIIYSFYKISLRTTNSLFLFTILVLSPAIGFDFLSIIRQGLATSFIILGYNSSLNRSKFKFVFYLLAILTHITAIIFIIPFVLRYLYRLALQSRLKLILILIIFGMALILFIPVVISSGIVNPLYFIELYITNKDSVSSGKFVLLYWMLAIFSLVIYTKTVSYTLPKYNVTTAIMFFLIYFLFWKLSPPAARLMWYFLPIYFFKLIIELEKNTKISGFRNYKIAIVILTATSAYFGISIAHNNFWYGFYE